MAVLENWYVIINPSSGNGASKRKWTTIKECLERYDFDYCFEFTTHSKHSSELLQAAVLQGFKKFICVGGDGTIHNIVNGIMSQTTIPSSQITLGIIPVGTGNDWVKTYNIPKDIEEAIRLIKNGRIKRQDIGEIEFNNNAFPPVFFNNLSGIGFDGYVVSKVKKYKHLGAISYLTGTLLGLLWFNNFKTTVSFNSEKITTNALMVLIGLCQYSGGGMQLTKNSDPQDGYFDISIAENFGKMDIVLNIVRLFNGKIVNSKKIITSKTTSVTVEVDAVDSPLVQADGELIGSGSFKVTLIPEAFSFYA